MPVLMPERLGQRNRFRPTHVAPAAGMDDAVEPPPRRHGVPEPVEREDPLSYPGEAAGLHDRGPGIDKAAPAADLAVGTKVEVARARMARCRAVRHEEEEPIH